MFLMLHLSEYEFGNQWFELFEQANGFSSKKQKKQNKTRGSYVTKHEALILTSRAVRCQDAAGALW